MILIFSSILFAGETYDIQGVEREEIVENIDSKAKEMLNYYNEKDIENFCKYCSEDLSYEFKSDPTVITNWRDEYGKYTEIGDIEIRRIAGTYYIEYPIIFENSSTQYYFILTLLSTNSDIYGFFINTEKY